MTKSQGKRALVAPQANAWDIAAAGFKAAPTPDNRDRLLSTPAPDAAGLAVKIATAARLPELIGFDLQNPEHVASILSHGETEDKALLACYWDALRLAGQPVAAPNFPELERRFVAWRAAAENHWAVATATDEIVMGRDHTPEDVAAIEAASNAEEAAWFDFAQHRCKTAAELNHKADLTYRHLSEFLEGRGSEAAGCFLDDLRSFGKGAA